MSNTPPYSLKNRDGQSSARRENLLAFRTFLATLVVGAVGIIAWGQVAANPGPSTEQPSQRNPFPKQGAGTQNRGRASDDKYWGVLDGDRSFVSATNPTAGEEIPFSRLPDQGFTPRLQKDGFQFPRLADRDPLRASRTVDQNQTLGTFPPNGTSVFTTETGGTFVGNDWTAGGPNHGAGGLTPGVVLAGPAPNGPSENPIGPDYQRAIAVPRSSAPIDSIPAAVRAASVFTWFPNVPGAVGTVQRFQIRVHLPSPVVDAVPPENRITDARYRIYYSVKTGTNTFANRTKTVILSQDQNGYVSLTDATTGTALLFPFFSEATYADPAYAGLRRARIELDNTTNGETSQSYVLADAMEFIPLSGTGVVKAAVTATPIHGGRKVAPPVALGSPITQAPGITPRQRSATQRNPYLPAAATFPGLLNDSFDFINNPRQVDYTGNPEAPGSLDPIYTDAANIQFEPLEPWNPSTLFQGPASLIESQIYTPDVPAVVTDGKDNVIDAASQFEPTYVRPYNPVTGLGRTNNQLYRNLTTGEIAPFFSHMQILVPRTELRPDPADPEGLRSIEIGCVYSVDWQTGAPVWRFPDRTYLPQDFKDQYGNTVYNAGLRNPQVNTDPITGRPVYQIPGIGAFDKNTDGVIEDDEVYIVGQGGNVNAGISAGITIAPRVQVQGIVRVPAYNQAWSPYVELTTATTSNTANASRVRDVITAPAGRYAEPVTLDPVDAAVAYIAADNGVIYAIDAYGNNDNQYYENPADTTQFGTYYAGSTNILWTFSATTRNRFINSSAFGNETQEQYNRFLKGRIPATGGFGGSSPVIAYAKEDTDPTLNRTTEEPRLFAGNSNGVLYAMDARALGGLDNISPGVNALRPLPFRKGEAVDSVVPRAATYRQDLKWWFETEGAIASTPAVSLVKHFEEDPTAAANDPLPVMPTPIFIISKGVYVTTLEGRVYCVDWTGPTLKYTGLNNNHVTSVIWDGTTGNLTDENVDANTAEQLNDNFRFHNDAAARPLNKADGTEGTIRPRWVFPQRYRDIDLQTDNSILAPQKPTDVSRVFGGSTHLREPANLGPIYGAPSLMDFVWYNPVTMLNEVKRYVVVAANDPASDDDAVTNSGIYLLDQAGDRRDFTTNPSTLTSGTTTVTFSHPVDKFTLVDGQMGKAAPAWSFRNVYKRLNALTGDEVAGGLQQRNSPDDDPTGGFLTPTKRLQPTIYAGGVGKLYALDIDPQTGILARYRADGGTWNQLFPEPQPRTWTVPAQLPTTDVRVNRPENPVLAVEGLNRRRVYVREIPFTGDSSPVDGSLTITGGPPIDRNTPPGNTNLPTIPTLPTNDTPNLISPSVELQTLVPQPFRTDPLSAPTSTVALAFDHSSTLPTVPVHDRYVNQDIDDPTSTSLGSALTVPLFLTDENRAYQYPVIFATTKGGYLHEVSTNTEGEAPDDSTASTTDGASLGWALEGVDQFRYNPRHCLLFSQLGPGGAGTQVAVVSNAYFPSLDPSYRNDVTKLTTDPSAAQYPSYPPNEPSDDVNNTTLVGPGDGVLDERPHFKPRSLYSGNGADDDGPDDDASTPDGIPAQNADAHTGRSGFPLDLTGRYFDKQYWAADLGGVNSNANDDGMIRLPGYSRIGALLTPGLEHPSDNLPSPLAGNPLTADNDDVNGTGRNAVWIYCGGTDGIFYAYTPSRYGLSSGLEGGIDNAQSDSALAPPGRVDFFDKSVFDTLLTAAQNGTITSSTAIRPDRDGRVTGNLNTASLVAQGKKPFFEWGETVYIIAYDLPWSDTGIPGLFPDNVTITITNKDTGAVIRTQTVRLVRGSDNNVSTYHNDSLAYAIPPKAPYDDLDNTNNPRGYPDDNTPLSLAFFRFQLNGGSSNTPGAKLEVRIQQNTSQVVQVNGRRIIFSAALGGATEAQALDSMTSTFVIANPLAIQSFVSNNTDGQVATLDSGDAPFANAIGPFQSVSDSNAVNAPKKKVASATAPPVPTTNDPDKLGFEYSQALSNGNRIERWDYDIYQQPVTPGSPVRNPNYLNRLTTSAGGTDADFYIPIAAGAAFIDHGKTGSSDIAADQRQLRIANRSLLNILPKVRVQVDGDLIWRTWPGSRPNVDATDGAINGNGLSTPGGDNTRKTPVITAGANAGAYAMRPDGIINYLPWEQPVLESQPWKTNSTVFTPTGTYTARGNPSLDYADVAARPESTQGKDTLRAISATGDLVRGPGSLSALGTPGIENLSISDANLRAPYASSGVTALRDNGVALSLTMPKYQAANLVAMHSLTSTYVGPSLDDDPLNNNATGPVQLPRDITANPRQLRRLDRTGGLAEATVAPFGYTTKLKVYVDSNDNGTWDTNEAYREVEVWAGVPVDIKLKQNATVVELGGLNGSGLGHGFGHQNGLLGYNIGSPSIALNLGFVPPPLFSAYQYDSFFKTFTVQNEGNVNLYNLRASQKLSASSTGNPYVYYGMTSETVDSKYGILAMAVDPIATNPAGLMPNVVTSIDKLYDATWNAYLADPTLRPDLAWPLNPSLPVGPTNPTRYQAYYAGLAGRHTLHKPRAGSTTGTVLSVPDVPVSAMAPTVDPTTGGLVPPPTAEPTRIGVAVPLGTPSGVYKSKIGQPPYTSFNSPFSIFEDHDTDVQYLSRPVPTGSTNTVLGPLQSAGPLYASQNQLHPGANAILPVNAEGILRPRSILPSGLPEYLPGTDPNLEMIVKVSESGLTGQVSDQAVNAAGFPVSITTGVLPSIDSYPLFNLTSGRPASSFMPAAFRSVGTGRLNVYFASTVDASTGTRIRGGQTTASNTYGLYRSYLDWDAAQGVWVAADPGAPVSGTSLAAPANTAGWFNFNPAEVVGTNNINESNVNPYVMYDPVYTAGTATVPSLFWLNSVPVGGGGVVNLPYFSAIDANGNPGTPTRLFPATGNNALDPAVRRYGPRAVYVKAGGAGTSAAGNSAFIFYYGGPAGKMNLIYTASAASGTGALTATGGNYAVRERTLSVPNALTATSEPSAAVRYLPPAIDEPNPSINPNATPDNRSNYVVNVYYTGVSRINGNADLYLNRYRINGSGNGAVLTGIDLGRIDGEPLVASSREALYRSRHIGWYQQLTDNPKTPLLDDRVKLPEIFLNGTPLVANPGAASPSPQQLAWKFDQATGLLYQRFIGIGGKQAIVYVDTAAGVVRFRGQGSPTPGVANQVLTAAYTPTTIRLTTESGADSGAMAFIDRRPAADTLTENPSLIRGIISRPTPFLDNPAGTGQGIDRFWLFWQRSAQPGQPATLYYTVRRVGIDLKAFNIIPEGDSIKLGPRDASYNQVPDITLTVNGNPIPMEIDVANGRIYTQAIYEGQIARVTGSYTTSEVGAPSTPIDVSLRLRLVDEVAPSAAGNSGQAVPMARAVNEEQPYPFLDLYNDPVFGASPIGRGANAPGGNSNPIASLNPNVGGDPTLQSGRVWLFWSSSRGRSGVIRSTGTGGVFPFQSVPGMGTYTDGVAVPFAGYDIFWQALAPSFTTPTFSSFP